MLFFRIARPIFPSAWRQMSQSNRNSYLRGIPNGGCCGWRPSPTFRGPVGPFLPQQQAEIAQRTLELRLRETIITPVGAPRPVDSFLGQYARHHIFPQSREFADFFRQAGIDVNQFTIVIPREHHIATHSGIGQGSGGWWNNQWRIFKENNPRAGRAEIFQQANRMILQQQLMGPIQRFRERIPDVMLPY
ncbi:MAG: TIGR02269 family lipoprotein [Acidobacteria bacterium]|nr:TIGR02269 family lipoprotein [Acidobacteriota bacterium]